MNEWIPCEGGVFIEADVIRWQEAVWERRGPKQGRAVKIGDRILIAEVLNEDEENGWVWLLVRDCVDVAKLTRRDLAAPKRESTIRRKRSTVSRGRPERLLWSDESVRARLIAEGASLKEKGAAKSPRRKCGSGESRY